MTIDEAINTHKLQSNESIKYNDRRGVFYDTEEHEQLADWLEELKAHRAIGTVEECKDAVENIEKFYYLGYNKAIDDFANQMEAEIESSAKFIKEYDNSIAQKAYHSGLCLAKRIAERLKAGGTNGNSTTDN